MPRETLYSAYIHKKIPGRPGVYKIYHHDQLMKVGKAVDGLRKRCSDYYRGKEGGTAHLPHITDENRDEVEIYWEECAKDDCRCIETEWYDEAKANGEKLPWSTNR